MGRNKADTWCCGEVLLEAEQVQLAINNGLTRANVYARIDTYGWEVERALNEPKRGRKSWIAEYCIYKGDSLFHIGTAQECAEKLGVKLESFQWYTTPTGKRRIENRKNPDKCMFIELLEDDDDDEMGGERV